MRTTLSPELRSDAWQRRKKMLFGSGELRLTGFGPVTGSYEGWIKERYLLYGKSASALYADRRLSMGSNSTRQVAEGLSREVLFPTVSAGTARVTPALSFINGIQA